MLALTSLTVQLLASSIVKIVLHVSDADVRKRRRTTDVVDFDIPDEPDDSEYAEDPPPPSDSKDVEDPPSDGSAAAGPPAVVRDTVVPGPRGGIEMQSVLGKACYSLVFVRTKPALVDDLCVVEQQPAESTGALMRDHDTGVFECAFDCELVLESATAGAPVQDQPAPGDAAQVGAAQADAASADAGPTLGQRNPKRIRMHLAGADLSDDEQAEVRRVVLALLMKFGIHKNHAL